MKKERLHDICLRLSAEDSRALQGFFMPQGAKPKWFARVLAILIKRFNSSRRTS